MRGPIALEDSTHTHTNAQAYNKKIDRQQDYLPKGMVCLSVSIFVVSIFWNVCGRLWWNGETERGMMLAAKVYSTWQKNTDKQASKQGKFLFNSFFSGWKKLGSFSYFVYFCLRGWNSSTRSFLFLSFRFVCGNFYFKTIYWSPPDTYFMPLKC